MSVGLWQVQIAKERIRHRCVVMLSGVNDERQEGFGTLFHRGHDWRHFHEVGPRTDDVDDFQHFLLATKRHKKHKMYFQMTAPKMAFSYVPFVPFCGKLKSDDSCAAFAPDVAIQSVACVDDERHDGADALVVDVAVIGDDDHTVSGLQLIVCQRYRA